jgi:hypothetical protein
MGLSWNGEAAEECGGIVQGNPYFIFLIFPSTSFAPFA